jgi:hypothetical protein
LFSSRFSNTRVIIFCGMDGSQLPIGACSIERLESELLRPEMAPAGHFRNFR